MAEKVQRMETLYKQSPWISLPTADWSPVLKYARLNNYKKGDIIYHQNSPTSFVYIIKHGRVNLSILSDTGEEKCLYVAAEGCIFGETVQMEDHGNCAQSTAKTDCAVYLVDGGTFMEYAFSNTTIIKNTMQVMVKKLRLFTGQIELITFFDTFYRVCEMLSYLVSQYGVKCEEGVCVEMRFTHQELADLVGASRVTVTNMLNELGKSGLIQKRGGKYLIPDPQLLVEYATNRENKDYSERDRG